MLLIVVIATLSRNTLAVLRPYALFVLMALVAQLMIGTIMVLKTFPLPVAVMHNAGAALLLLSLVALYRKVCDIAVPRARAL
jgi:cytochrome c oxidase assembly protein subunit 15